MHMHMVEITQIWDAFGQPLRCLPPHCSRRAIASSKLPEYLCTTRVLDFLCVASKNAPDHHERGIVCARPLSINTT